MESMFEGATAGAAALVWSLMLAGCIMIVVSISGLVIVRFIEWGDRLKCQWKNSRNAFLKTSEKSELDLSCSPFS